VLVLAPHLGAAASRRRKQLATRKKTAAAAGMTRFATPTPFESTMRTLEASQATVRAIGRLLAMGDSSATEPLTESMV
jgi:hypothetical protein